jgi:hypothetical protein
VNFPAPTPQPLLVTALHSAATELAAHVDRGDLYAPLPECVRTSIGVARDEALRLGITQPAMIPQPALRHLACAWTLVQAGGSGALDMVADHLSRAAAALSASRL